MKRLTVADEKHSDGRMVFHQVGYITSDMAYELYWALKKYEDTGYGPEVFQRLNRPETPYEIAADEEIRRLRAQNDSLTAELAVVKRERDAAVHDVYECAECDQCRHAPCHGDVCKERLRNTPKDSACFEWRDPCAENAQEVGK